MKSTFYQIIYSPTINFLLRNINKVLVKMLPKLVKLPPSGTLKIAVDQRHILLRANQTSYLAKLLFWNGASRFEYTAIFSSLIKKVDSFFDIGANIGYYSLVAGTHNEQCSIHAFEPALGPHHFLQENVKLNDLGNVIVEKIALADTTGEIDFYEVTNPKYPYLTHNLAGEGNAGSKTTGRNYRKNTVKSTTFEKYVEKHNIEKIDLIKMDTEGTEHLILSKADKVLKEFKPIIICETLFGFIEGELDQLFSSYGYEFYNHVEGGLKKTNTLLREADNGVTNCFFVHPDKKSLIEEYLI